MPRDHAEAIKAINEQIGGGSPVKPELPPKRSILFITGQTVDVAEVPTHLVISMRQPFKAEDIYRSQQVAAEWLVNGGVLLVNDDGTGLKMVSADVPEAVVVEADKPKRIVPPVAYPPTHVVQG